MIAQQQLFEAGERLASPKAQTDQVLTHVHAPVR
jgi:hypothetical protein